MPDSSGGGCTTDPLETYEVQQVVVMGQGRPGRPTELINLHPRHGQRPGSVIFALNYVEDCEIDGVAYKKYSGTFQ